MDRETAHLLRDVLDLPESERVEFFERLREDLADATAPSEIDVLNERMSLALETFNNVCEHLGYDHEILKLGMKMREFDAVPSRIRDGCKARDLAAVYHGSWDLVKAAAIGEALPINPTQRRKRQRHVKETRKNARYVVGIREFLASNPERTSLPAYNKWRAERNAQLAEGERPFVTANAIAQTWGRPWREIIADAKAGTLKPPTTVTDHPYAAEQADEDSEIEPPREVEPADPESFEYNPAVVARRLRQARDAAGLSLVALSRATGLSQTTLREIEDGTRQKATLASVVKLASYFRVSIDYFVTPDGKEGFPVRETERGGDKP